MRNYDKSGLASAPWLRDIGVACALLTRLPLPKLPDDAFARQSRAAWAFALAGVAVAGVAGVAATLFMSIGLPAPAAAGVFLAVQIAATGAMHEDGLADTADGLWGGHDRARRLEIMKDSAVGTYGVLALVLAVGLRWVAISALLPTGIGAMIAAAALSRGGLPLLMTTLPHARPDGLSRSVGAPTMKTSRIALGIGAGVAVLLCGFSVLVPAVLAGLAVYALARIALAKIGGQTGDILGASQQVAEIVLLLGLMAYIS